ncbi:metal ABC transporter permease [Kiloniella sp. b19]|uniref:metal ABC transporter permease n=1 Tax=Kiloniella sp. GXU_MW_B19 TaxID=3141326 RepID=UPI0031D6ADA7
MDFSVLDIPLIDFLQIDLPALLVAVFAAIVCAIPGSFLVLRKQSLIGDAISHVVLPGIVAGFLLSGTLAAIPMTLGALGAAVISVLLIELIRVLGKIETGAAMGVVFTSMFALGVVMLEQTGSSGVHLDVEHALYGNLESTLWLGLEKWSDLWSARGWETMPLRLQQLSIALICVVAFVSVFFKELKLSTFDPLLATSLGFSARIMSFGLVIATALAAVSAFGAVGAILAIAMFICPPSAARMLTDRLSSQLWLSALYAGLSAILGYGLAAFGPLVLGTDFALNAAGMIAVVAFVLQFVTMLLAPRYGILSRRIKSEIETEKAPS